MTLINNSSFKLSNVVMELSGQCLDMCMAYNKIIFNQKPV